MDVKRYVVGSLAVWFFMFIFEFLLHGVALKGMYQEIIQILRPEENMMQFFAFVVLGELIIALGVCYIFIKGREGKGVVEGLRFGLAIGITFGVGVNLIDYAVYPIPGKLIAAMSIGTLIEAVLAGAIIAAIYQPETARVPNP